MKYWNGDAWLRFYTISPHLMMQAFLKYNIPNQNDHIKAWSMHCRFMKIMLYENLTNNLIDKAMYI